MERRTRAQYTNPLPEWVPSDSMPLVSLTIAAPQGREVLVPGTREGWKDEAVRSLLSTSESGEQSRFRRCSDEKIHHHQASYGPHLLKRGTQLLAAVSMLVMVLFFLAVVFLVMTSGELALIARVLGLPKGAAIHGDTEVNVTAVTAGDLQTQQSVTNFTVIGAEVELTWHGNTSMSSELCESEDNFTTLAFDDTETSASPTTTVRSSVDDVSSVILQVQVRNFVCAKHSIVVLCKSTPDKICLFRPVGAPSSWAALSVLLRYPVVSLTSREISHLRRLLGKNFIYCNGYRLYRSSH